MKTKRVLSFLLAMLMCLTLLPAIAVSAGAAGDIEYIANADFTGAAANTYEKTFGLVCKEGYHTAHSLATKVVDGVLVAQYDDNAKTVKNQSKAYIDLFNLTASTTVAPIAEDFTLSLQMKLIGEWTRSAYDFAYVKDSTAKTEYKDTFSIANNRIMMKTADGGTATSSSISTTDFSTVEFRFDFEGGVYVAIELWVNGVLVGRNNAAGNLDTISWFRLGTTDVVGNGIALDSIKFIKGHHTVVTDVPVDPEPINYITEATFTGATPSTYENVFGLVCKEGFHTTNSNATQVKDGVLYTRFDQGVKTTKTQAYIDLIYLNSSKSIGSALTEDFTLSLRMSLLGNWNRTNTDFAYVNANGNNNTFSVVDNCIKMVTADGTASNGATVVAGTATSPRISSTRFSTVEFRFDFENGAYIATELWVDGALVGRNNAKGNAASITHFRLGTTYTAGQGIAIDYIALVEGHHTLATEEQLTVDKYTPGVAASVDFTNASAYPTETALINDFYRANCGLFPSYESTTIENGALNLAATTGGNNYVDFRFYTSTIGKMTESFTLSMNIKPIGTWCVNKKQVNFMSFQTENANNWQKYFYGSDGKLCMETDNGDVYTEVLPTDSYTTLELMLEKKGNYFNKVSCYINGELLGTKTLTTESLTSIGQFRMFSAPGAGNGVSIQSFSILNGNYSLYQAAQTANADLVYIGSQDRVNADGTIDLRFITGIKNMEAYKAVANTIFVNGAATASFNGETKTVYSSILAEDPAGETTVVTAASEGVEGLYAAAVRGIPAKGYYSIKVVSSAVGEDGRAYTNVYEYAVNDGEIIDLNNAA